MYYLFTESFKALPGLKVGSVAALIWIGAPVCGLRPVRAARSFTENVPKPTNATDSPLVKVSVIAAIVASNARPAAAFGMSADAAIASINSDLFTVFPFIIESIIMLFCFFGLSINTKTLYTN